jgi:putative membrane protein
MMGYGYNGFDRFGHMGSGGWVMMLGGFLLFLLFVVLVVGLIRMAMGRGRHGHHGPMHGAGCCGHEGHEGHGDAGGPEDSALTILGERYAKGEIGDEEYAKKKAELKK